MLYYRESTYPPKFCAKVRFPDQKAKGKIIIEAFVLKKCLYGKIL